MAHEGHHHDHDHEHEGSQQSDIALRVRALESLLTEKGYIAVIDGYGHSRMVKVQS